MKKNDYINGILERLGLEPLDVDPDAAAKRSRAILQLPDMLRQLQSGTVFMKTHTYIPFFLFHIEQVAYTGEKSNTTYSNTRSAISMALSILLDMAEVDEPYRDTIFAVWEPYFLSCIPVQDRQKLYKS